MRILGIESSCDETALAIVEQNKEGKITVIKQSLSSQISIHEQYGGVVPEIAAREHANTIPFLLEQLSLPKNGNGIDRICVTYGPGLVPSLRIGVELSKTLAHFWQKPLFGINHLEGHIYSVLGEEQSEMIFPAICLLVSGGHTELILMKNHGEYELLGLTRDDACGEAFDKVGKLLGLSYPAGPKISQLAKNGNREAVKFPRPMIGSLDLDFSFSGLKTAVRVFLEQTETKPSLEDLCASFEQAVVDVLISKTQKALNQHNAASLILCGGVSANTYLKESLSLMIQKQFSHVRFCSPKRNLSGDNAIMIALSGLFQKEDRAIPAFELEAKAQLRLC